MFFTDFVWKFKKISLFVTWVTAWTSTLCIMWRGKAMQYWIVTSFKAAPWPISINQSRATLTFVWVILKIHSYNMKLGSYFKLFYFHVSEFFHKPILLVCNKSPRLAGSHQIVPENLNKFIIRNHCFFIVIKVSISLLNYFMN